MMMIGATCLPYTQLVGESASIQDVADGLRKFHNLHTAQGPVKFEEASYFEDLALNISYIGYKILALNSEDGNIVAKLKDDKFSIVAISYDASDFITAKCERL